ncbi:MAG: chemotaxis protein CheW [Campylobacterota bacterium]|nr:chemotaxis protein CheW [Campylobacterota bacterium]
MELIIFDFLNATYAIELHKTKVILVYKNTMITPVAIENPWILGFTNLRGEVTPIVDLRIKFSKAKPVYAEDTVIIVVKTDEDKLIGMVIDKIKETKVVDLDDLSITPDMSLGMDPKYIQGLKKDGKDMIAVLDIDSVMNIKELTE